MPTYTHEATGRQITSETPLSPADLDAAFAPTPENLQGYATAEAHRQGLPPDLALSVLRAPAVTMVAQSWSSPNIFCILVSSVWVGSSCLTGGFTTSAGWPGQAGAR